MRNIIQENNLCFCFGQSIQENEDDVDIGVGPAPEISDLLGSEYEHLYPKILYLVMADSAYCEGKLNLKSFTIDSIFLVFIQYTHDPGHGKQCAQNVYCSGYPTTFPFCTNVNQWTFPLITKF